MIKRFMSTTMYSHDQYVYKIVTKKNWNKFAETRSKTFMGFENDRNFIHMSTHEQVYDIFKNKYQGNKNLLNLLCIDLNETTKVKWERHRNGLVYPHMYGGIKVYKYNGEVPRGTTIVGEVPYVTWVRDMKDIIFYDLV